MGPSDFNFATHLSIVWGVTLAILTLLEWRSLDRDPMRKQILSPFIEREISVRLVGTGAVAETVFEDPLETLPDEPEPGLQYVVEFGFNGLLFLACFFVPVLAFHALGWLIALLRKRAGPPAG